MKSPARLAMKEFERSAFDHIGWIVQTIHQAYHKDMPGTWHTCPHDVCMSTMRWWTEHRKEIMNLISNRRGL